MDYEPSIVVKPHTLDQRLIETVNASVLYECKQKLLEVEKVMEILTKNITLSIEDQNHKKYLQTLVTQNLKKVKDFLRKNPTVFDQRKHFLVTKSKLLEQMEKIKRNIADNRQT
jgi:ApbE superfamily uncharacterized protein (UPF0280 family)